MDLQAEREAFEKHIKETYCVDTSSYKFNEERAMYEYSHLEKSYFDLLKEMHERKSKENPFPYISTDTMLECCEEINAGFDGWIAAKKESEKELIKQIEINKRLVEQIEKLKVQAVPHDHALLPIEPTQKLYRTFYDAFNSANAGNTAQCFKVAYKAMIEAQEQTNECE